MKRFASMWIVGWSLWAGAAREAIAQQTPSSSTPMWGVQIAPATLVQSRNLSGNGTPVAGGGLAIEVARALGWSGRGFGSTAFLAARAGTIGNTGDSYEVSELSAGLRIPLVGASGRWRPYVQMGLGVRFAQTQAADGLQSRTVESWSPSATAGIGQRVQLRGDWSLDIGLRGEFGPWSTWRRDDGSRPPNERTAVGTLRAASGAFLLGVRWGR